MHANAFSLNMWSSSMLLKTVGVADSNSLGPYVFSRWHCTLSLTDCIRLWDPSYVPMSPPPPQCILSLWTILNDDCGDYVLVIPARSLKECPCCVLNTQRRDYADPYMWCCGCIPPVRLNPICYRFGLKKRGAVSTKGRGGGRGRCGAHALQYIPLLLYHGGSELNLPLEAVFLFFYVKKESWLVLRLCALLFLLSRFSPFFKDFYFPFVVEANPNPPTVSPWMWVQLNTHVDFHIDAHKR